MLFIFVASLQDGPSGLWFSGSPLPYWIMVIPVWQNEYNVNAGVWLPSLVHTSQWSFCTVLLSYYWRNKPSCWEEMSSPVGRSRWRETKSPSQESSSNFQQYEWGLWVTTASICEFMTHHTPGPFRAAIFDFLTHRICAIQQMSIAILTYYIFGESC